MLYVVSKYFLEKIVNFVIQGIDTSKNFCKHIFQVIQLFICLGKLPKSQIRVSSKITDQIKFQGQRSRQLSLKITDQGKFLSHILG